MTIKQQGGIFGRNPTFNDVTVEGTLTTSGAQSVEELNVDNINIDGNTISSTNTNGNVTVDPDGTGYLDVQLPATAGVAEGLRITNPQNAGTFGDGASIRFQNTPDASNDRHARIECFSRGAYGQSTSLRFLINNGTAAPRNVFQMLGDTGDVYVTEANLRLSGGGNVIMNSGSGIDFSATSDATGSTSELFDDYEEGTWTPTYLATGTDFTSVTYDAQEGYYTKIGDTVIAYCNIRTDALSGGSGDVRISGLPFSALNARNSVSVWPSGFGGDNPTSGFISGSAVFLYFQTASNATTTTLDASDMGTGTNANRAMFSAVYKTSS